MELPERLDGIRVLDVGARDGYFSFAAERRGAEVLAVDSMAPHLTGFATAASLVGSSVEYRTTNVYDLDPEDVGTFDAIFFLGVLYHLRDPMLALDRLREVARPEATIWVESHVIDQQLVDPKSEELKSLSSVAPELVDVPIAQFYPGGLLSGDGSNWWGPNLAGLKAMVESAGFEVLRSRLVGNRGLVVGRKIENEETLYFREVDRKVVDGVETREHDTDQASPDGEETASP
jgi:tRNA (mo5U34)-methyltransferase